MRGCTRVCFVKSAQGVCFIGDAAFQKWECGSCLDCWSCGVPKREFVEFVEGVRRVGAEASHILNLLLVIELRGGADATFYGPIIPHGIFRTAQGRSAC